ncbi:hypothetical protein [Bradyrhizobium ottawaense]|uniref:hypothetical protein n=1 Tax=Bradyrhizobium ottawaense TaxID=931866 RepID=UPI0015CF0451|nr:hypothetical protein [Bradyrhizobium ottawaense]
MTPYQFGGVLMFTTALLSLLFLLLGDPGRPAPTPDQFYGRTHEIEREKSKNE